MRQIHIVILNIFKRESDAIYSQVQNYKKNPMVYACHSQKVEFNAKSRGKAGQTW